jgi:hypothetical protein
MTEGLRKVTTEGPVRQLHRCMNNRCNANILRIADNARHLTISRLELYIRKTLNVSLDTNAAQMCHNYSAPWHIIMHNGPNGTNGTQFAPWNVSSNSLVSMVHHFVSWLTTDSLTVSCRV